MLYIVRIGGIGNNNIIFCSPCHDCYSRIKNLGIQKIVSINEQGEIIHSKVNELNVTHISLGNRLLGKTV